MEITLWLRMNIWDRYERKRTWPISMCEYYWRRSQWTPGLRRRSWSLGRWDRGFETRLRLSSPFCVVLSCVGSGLASGWSPSKESYQMWKWFIISKSNSELEHVTSPNPWRSKRGVLLALSLSGCERQLTDGLGVQVELRTWGIRSGCGNYYT
jgi:hypothetical protein